MTTSITEFYAVMRQWGEENRVDFDTLAPHRWQTLAKAREKELCYPDFKNYPVIGIVKFGVQAEVEYQPLK